MMEQNLFTLGGDNLFAWVVPPDLALEIRKACVEEEQPYLSPPPVTERTLFARGLSGDYTLHLGDPRKEEEEGMPTVREYLKTVGVDADDEDALRAYLMENEIYEEADLDESPVSPDWSINECGLFDDWLHEQETKGSTMAQAHNYLGELPLTDESGSTGAILGDLRFYEGDRPGSNVVYVEAKGLATLACLQERLKHLGEKTEIQILPSQL